MDTVYYNYSPGIFDVFKIASQQYHKVDIIIVLSLQIGSLRLRKNSVIYPRSHATSNRAGIRTQDCLSAKPNLVWNRKGGISPIWSRGNM